MTPLARKIVEQRTLPINQRTFDDDEGKILNEMSDIHCFDITEILELCKDLARDLLDHPRDMPDTTSFLPAPRTWIEYNDNGLINGFLLIDKFNGTASRFEAQINECNWASYRENDFILNERNSSRVVRNVNPPTASNDFLEYVSYIEVERYHSLTLLVALAMINTPKIIGRRQKMPQRKLERDILNSKMITGNFPLHAWTEIVLKVNTNDTSGDPVVEAHLTGKKALHFCRAHLRIKCGRVEFVKAHWRGDASIGIKRSRYKLTGNREVRQSV